MPQNDAVNTLRYLATHYWSLQGLRLVPLSLIFFYQPPSRAGWFGASLSLRNGTIDALVAQAIVIAAALAGWFWVGRYYRRWFGEVGLRPSGVEFWARCLGAWLIYCLLLPVGHRVHVDVSALWLAALCVMKAKSRFPPGPRLGHFALVAGALSAWAFVPLLVSARDPGAWAMSDVLLGVCALVIAVGDHLALRRMMADLSAVARQPPFCIS